MKISFELNGSPVEVDLPPMTRLLDLLREELGLTGTKEGCGEGECGSCTVLLDGKPVCSCLVPAVQVEGRQVLSIEGVAQGEELSAVQRSMVERGGVQCGACTPGIVISAEALLDERPAADREEIREAVAGNLCRCTGYQRVVDAVEAAARARGAAS